MTRAAPKNAPVVASPSLPWAVTAPSVSARPAGPFAPAGCVDLPSPRAASDEAVKIALEKI